MALINYSELTPMLSIIYFLLSLHTLFKESGSMSTKNETFRLVNGSNQFEGTVQVFHNGTWYLVCDNNWDILDASVVCHQLGYVDAIAATRYSHFGISSGPIWLNDVECVGNESTLLDYQNDSNHECTHSNNAGVICTNQHDHLADIRLRLVNGNVPNEGRVEIFYNNTWGTICDNYWSVNDAKVVCRQLGYDPSQGAKAYTSAYFGPGTGPVYLDRVRCVGNEESITECSFVGFGYLHNDCSHKHDASVQCNGTKVTCHHLPPVPHLIINFTPQSNNTDNISFGTIVRFQCEPGYYLSGYEITRCTNNGKWSHLEPSCLPYNSSMMSSLLITTLSSVITTSLTSLWTTTHPLSSITSTSTSTISWYSESLIISTTSLVVSSQSSPDSFISNTFTSITASEFIISRTLSSSLEFSSISSIISQFVSSHSTTISSVISPSVLSTSFHFSTSDSLAILSSTVATVYSFSSSSIVTKFSTLSFTASKSEVHSSVIPSPSSVFVSISFTFDTNSSVTAFESAGSSIAKIISVFISPTSHAPRLSSSQDTTAIIAIVCTLGGVILLLISVIVIMAVIVRTLWKRHGHRRSNFLIPNDKEEKEENIKYDNNLELSRRDSTQVAEHEFQSADNDDHEQFSQPCSVLIEEEDQNLII